MIKHILFDFDGVIMDSMQLKLDSYCYAFEQLNYSRQKIKNVQYKFAGLSRHKALKLMYGELTGEEITPGLNKTFIERFTDHDDKMRIHMKFVPGTELFLKSVYQNYFTAVVTGTPQEVIDKTIKVHHLNKFFNIVCGTPPDKKDGALKILKDNNLEINETVFIGDALVDQQAADYCSVKFVGIDRGDTSFDHEKAWKIVPSLEELLNLQEFDQNI